MRFAQKGFTLIELMVTISVLVILLGIAAPAFTEALLGNKLSSYANNFVASAALARGEALKRNSATTLCVSSNGTTCGSGGWEQGWVVLSSDGSVIQSQPAAAAGFKISEATSKTNLTFQPSGVGATSAALTVCRAAPTVGGQERTITLSVTGRTSVGKTTSGSCP